jgi:hypothetical protein
MNARNSDGSKNAVFCRGELESAGLAEVAYFLKKAKQNIEYARFALDSTDFSVVSDMLNPAENKIAEIAALIVSTRRSIEVAERNIAGHAEGVESERLAKEESDNAAKEKIYRKEFN